MVQVLHGRAKTTLAVLGRYSLHFIEPFLMTGRAV